MEKETKKSIFDILNAVNCNEHIERKNGLAYLSWAWAWTEVKKRYPKANYKIYEREDGRIYWDDGKTAWVKTSVIIDDIEHIEYLPVMNYNNESIPIERITSTAINKAIQRSLTKCCARHGLGLYVYAGEDLPEEEAIANRWIVNNIDDFLARLDKIKNFNELQDLWKHCSIEIKNNDSCREAVKEHPTNIKKSKNDEKENI